MFEIFIWESKVIIRKHYFGEMLRAQLKLVT